ncbi:MAG: HU family DNA-binding protein [Candidatus Comchoanobacterales bacterium]
MVVKSELINSLSYQLGDVLPSQDVEYGVNLILNIMSNTLVEGGCIEIRGFGSFKLRYREERVAHNPSNGKKVTTTSKYRPHFKPGKALRMRVDEGKAFPIKAKVKSRSNKEELAEEV